MASIILFWLFMLSVPIALLSLPALRHRLHPLEIVYGFFFATILMQQSFTIVGLNLGMLELAPGGLRAFMPAKLSSLCLYPALHLWLSAFVLSPGANPARKTLLAAGLLGLMVLAEQALAMTGSLIEHHWTWVHSGLRYMLLALANTLFIAHVRRLLCKEGAIR